MSPGPSTESDPAFACIGLRENPGKNLNQVTCPDRDSNPGYLVSRPDALTVTPQKDKHWNGIPKELGRWRDQEGHGEERLMKRWESLERSEGYGSK
ncbi:hypothetical protein ANN_04918 [Periplaneta americana]|uniref:Uncharacterized protein n=1 Tax=Periplaneta americana TaxID=6978 RepID=A0ABQ8TC42_PERAM|nr:hypothetical protein ANN_04918 [Periplaneta americana]